MPSSPTRTFDRRAPVATGNESGRDIRRAAMLLALAIGVFSLLYALSRFTSDSMDVGNRLKDESGSAAVLICLNGSMVHGDGSWTDFFTKKGYFQCNDWKMGNGAPTAR